MSFISNPRAPARIASASPDLLQDVASFATVVATLSLTIFLVLYCSFLSIRSNIHTPRIERPKKPKTQDTSASRVLISGAGNPVALALARLLQNHGYIIVMVDFETYPLLSPARFSKACSRFYKLNVPRQLDRTTISKDVKFSRFGTLEHPSVQTSMKGPSPEELYAADILAVMQHESIDLWIPCERPCREGPVTYKSFQRAKIAVEDVGKRCVCPNDDISALSRSFVAFSEFVNALHLPVRAPLGMIMHSRDDVHRALSKMPPGIKFSLEKIHRSVELIRTPTNSDLVLTDSRQNSTSGPQPPPIRRTSFDTSLESIRLSMQNRNATYNAVSRIAISEQAPWLLKEEVEGPKLISSAIIVDGRVRAFVAAESKINQAWKVMPPSSPLYPSILQFTQQFSSYQAHVGAMHLNITFAAPTTSAEHGFDTRIMPLACNTNLHETMTLLMSDESTSAALASVYGSLTPRVIPESTAVGEKLVNGINIEPMITHGHTTIEGLHKGCASLFTTLLAALIQNSMKSKIGTDFSALLLQFAEYIMAWKDETFDRDDPWPWWYVTNVQEPAKMLGKLVGKGYGRIFSKST